MTKLTQEDDALLSELGVEVEQKKAATRTPREERIIAGFEEIQRFVEEHGRTPGHGQDKDIFERIYAVRLDRIRAQQECRELVEELDHQGLLEQADDGVEIAEDMADDELLEALGVEAEETELTQLKHVRPRAEIKAAEEIANRERCVDFAKFKPLFEMVRDELDRGIRQSKLIRQKAGFLKLEIEEGRFFVLGGQTIYIASVGESFKAPNGERDARLRVIFSNGTESNLLLRSLQRAIYYDESSRLITEGDAGPLFGNQAVPDDLTSGTVYVLRSQSDHPMIAENRDVVHKIGVTGGDVKRRIANAANEATYLLADVEVVATYKLFNINRSRFERLLHKVLAPAQLDLIIEDRFGKPVKPREWFLVPLHIIEEIINRIQDGSISDVIYDVKTAQLKDVK